MRKNTYTEVKVPCVFYTKGSTLRHCEDCCFFNGEVEENGEVVGVDCLRDEIPSIRCHVTSFELNGERYVSREYSRDIDGEIEGDDKYDFCQKCCFDHRLKNGERICLLRCGVDNDELTNFTCYEGEIWEKVVK